jgi:hypothetical protein
MSDKQSRADEALQKMIEVQSTARGFDKAGDKKNAAMWWSIAYQWEKAIDEIQNKQEAQPQP